MSNVAKGSQHLPPLPLAPSTGEPPHDPLEAYTQHNLSKHEKAGAGRSLHTVFSSLAGFFQQADLTAQGKSSFIEGFS